MAAEPLRPPGELVADPLDGDGAAGTDHIDPATFERAQRVWRKRTDGIGVFLAGQANVVYQLAWPEVGHGVVESKVESGQVGKHPFKRFRTTVGYLGIAALGSDELRAAYREAVDGQHRQVRSGPDSPVKYNAFNRDLQLWVASCIFYGLHDLSTRMHGPMTSEEEELLLIVGSRMGTTLQVPHEMWHHNMAEFWAYWDEGMKRCHIDQPVREYFLWLLHVQMLPFPLNRMADRPMYWVNVGFLTPDLREQLGLEWTDRDQRRHDALMRLLGRAMRWMPTIVRQFPVNAMKLSLDTRRRLGLRMV